MKKTTKRLFAVVLAVLLCVSMSVVAFADEAATYAITVTTSVPNAGTLNAYQIFGGDLAPNTDPDSEVKYILSNVTWGANIDTAKIAENLGELTGLDLSDAANAAPAVAKWLNDNPTKAEAFAEAIAPCITGAPAATVSDSDTESADNVLTLTVGAPGYYLIKSEANGSTENYAATQYILEVVGPTSVTEKAEVPSVTKKVKDVNDSMPESDGEGTPENPVWQDSADHDIGDAVEFELTGTLPDDFASYDAYAYTFHDTLSAGLTYREDAKVYLVHADGTETEITGNFEVTSSGTTLTIETADLKAVEGVVNTDKVVVRYTATLNENAVIGGTGNPNEVYLEYSNNPNAGGSGDTGTTPEDQVVVFTYSLIVDKVDPEKAPLAGAGFTLSKLNASGEYEEVHLSQKKDDAGNVLYYYVDPDGEITEIAGEDITKFEFRGIDDGQYKLEETTTPSGYNTCDPIEFTVEATHDADAAAPTLTELKATVNGVTEEQPLTGEPVSGQITGQIINTEGNRLPSTGGIGVTIFYIVGAVLVIGAGVLLVTKKRMSSKG